MCIINIFLKKKKNKVLGFLTYFIISFSRFNICVAKYIVIYIAMKNEYFNAFECTEDLVKFNFKI